MSADVLVADTRPISYEKFVDGFEAEQIAAELSGDLDAGLNACVECCDRHAKPGRIALFWEGTDGRSEAYTFEKLREHSARLANFLRRAGVRPGDRVAGLLPRIPELLILMLGTWRLGAVYQPLFTAFGPKAIEHRAGASDARMIFTDANDRAKLAAVPTCPPIVTVHGRCGRDHAADDRDFWTELQRQPAHFEPVMRRGDDPFLMMFTSGTAGAAKGLMVPLKALLSIYVYMRYAINLPGTRTGTSPIRAGPTACISPPSDLSCSAMQRRSTMAHSRPKARTASSRNTVSATWRAHRRRSAC